MLPAAGKQRLLVVAGKRLPAGAGGQAVIGFGRKRGAQRLKGRGQGRSQTGKYCPAHGKTPAAYRKSIKEQNNG